MRILHLVALAMLFTLPACYQLEASAHVGYAQMAVDGDIGYVSGGSSANIDQDIGSAFGLGDDQGAPYGRVALDTGVQVFSLSALSFDDHGTGTLTANFGDNPNLIAGTNVRSDFEMTNVKFTYAFEIELGPVSLAPGIGIDYFDMSIQVQDEIGIATERVELNAPIPIGFLRGTVDLGFASLIGEVGFSSVNVDEVDGTLLDLEAMIVAPIGGLIDVFAGYRSLSLDVDGTIDNDSFDADLRVSGFLIGGGIRF